MVCAHTYACASLCLCDLLRVYNGRAVTDSADGRSKNTSHLLLSLRYISLSHSRPFLLTLPSRPVDTELERHLSSSVLVNENDSKAEIIYFELRTKTLAGRLLSPLQLANVHQTQRWSTRWFAKGHTMQSCSSYAYNYICAKINPCDILCYCPRAREHYI